MHRDGHAIANLYAIGSAAGGLEGGETVGYFGGIAKAVTSGLRAAEHIAGQRKAAA
jgi:fumarate reductase flavoprotein subunit